MNPTKRETQTKQEKDMNSYLLCINHRITSEFRLFSEALIAYQAAYEQYAIVELLDSNTMIEIDVSPWE